MSNIENKEYWKNDLYRLERLITEARELETKITNGINFIKEVDGGKIENFPQEQLDLIKIQMRLMKDYLEVLNSRIKILFKSINL